MNISGQKTNVDAVCLMRLLENSVHMFHLKVYVGYNAQLDEGNPNVQSNIWTLHSFVMKDNEISPLYNVGFMHYI